MRGDVDMRRIFSYNQGMKKQIKIAAVTALVLSAAAFIVIYFVPVTFSKDELCNKLWRDTLPRVALSAAIFSLCVLCGVRGLFAVKREGALRAAVWCIPCLLVALANFPYSALITGEALIDRPDLIWLFILKCLFIAVSEELLFRGILLWLFKDMFEGRRHSFLMCAVTSAAVFALFHLLNLLEGAGIGATLLQVGYTFLTGLMFTCAAMRTGSPWAPVALHFIFDIGGLIVTDIGSGPFQDEAFWALTAICAAICAVHLVFYALERDKKDLENFKNGAKNQPTKEDEKQ